MTKKDKPLPLLNRLANESNSTPATGEATSKYPAALDAMSIRMLEDICLDSNGNIKPDMRNSVFAKALNARTAPADTVPGNPVIEYR